MCINSFQTAIFLWPIGYHSMGRSRYCSLLISFKSATSSFIFLITLTRVEKWCQESPPSRLSAVWAHGSSVHGVFTGKPRPSSGPAQATAARRGNLWVYPRGKRSSTGRVSSSRRKRTFPGLRERPEPRSSPDRRGVRSEGPAWPAWTPVERTGGFAVLPYTFPVEWGPPIPLRWHMDICEVRNWAWKSMEGE